MEDFLMQFDIIECIDEIRQLDLFEVEQNLTIEDYIERIDDWLLKN